MANYDLIGNIAILKTGNLTKGEVRTQAAELLKIPIIKTVLAKADNIKGRLRTFKVKYLAGLRTTIANYKENGCLFRLDIKSCYFSPRMANDRLEIAKKIDKLKAKNVLVLFSGIAPYPLIIGKASKAKNIVAVELGKECCKYAEENVKLNKLSDKVKIIQGDVKRIIPKLAKEKQKFQVIIMARPNLKESFLPETLKIAKKGTVIYYHGFSHEDNLQTMIKTLEKEAQSKKRKLKILEIKQIGELAPYKHRYGIWMKVAN